MSDLQKLDFLEKLEQRFQVKDAAFATLLPTILLIRAHLNQALYIYIYIFWISKNKIFSNRKTFESSLCSLQVAIILEFNVEHTSILHIQSLVVIGCC